MNSKEIQRLTIVETDQKHIIKKVDGLCVGQRELDKKIEDIMSNHLPHLKEELVEKIDDIKTEVALAKLKIGLIVGATAFLATFIGTKLLEGMFK